MQNCIGIKRLEEWFQSKGWKVLDFQRRAWDAYRDGENLLINAPTGTGKTYAALGGPLSEAMEKKETGGIRILWLTPLRALSKEINISTQSLLDAIELDWDVQTRTGDTSTRQRKKQSDQPPEILITTPESVHILLSSGKHEKLFSQLEVLVVDEWHDLVGSKRGVLVQLAISRFRTLSPGMTVTGISATIGNMEEATHCLFGEDYRTDRWTLIQSRRQKSLEIVSLIPDKVESLPWSGHLGLRLIDLLEPIIENHESIICFTNTRGQCEIWYQKLLERFPNLAGIMAMHHGSMSRDLRDWVESELYHGRLKLVVSTSSLDLGVDFRPVDAVIQIGSPKSVSRLIQRAGRSGHQPDAASKIYFLPTHALELVEAAALRRAVREGHMENQLPYIRSIDVLVQYLCTLAVGGGFREEQIYKEIKTTFCFQSITPEEWTWILEFLQYGGSGLKNYDEYNRLFCHEGIYRIKDKKMAQRHKLSIGTIVSEAAIVVKYMNGKRLGSVEEYFLSTINSGETFWFAGRPLQLISIKGNTAYVKKSSPKKGRIPAWLGGRIPLSSPLAYHLRLKLCTETERQSDPEMQSLQSLFQLQADRSYMPGADEFLVEYIHSDEGFHLLAYPFAGRFVHEGISTIIAQRLSKHRQISFSIAMNDYGFELLSKDEIDVDHLIDHDLFDPKGIEDDILSSMEMTDLARRQFRHIAKISGLIFTGFPGSEKKERHLQSSSGLLFDVFAEYDPENMLYQQCYEELLSFQLQQQRITETLQRIRQLSIVLTRPEKFTPFAFPIIVDRLREGMSTESLEARIKRMTLS